jgi:hypothetical protein
MTPIEGDSRPFACNVCFARCLRALMIRELGAVGGFLRRQRSTVVTRQAA